ncbi:MAG: Kae1-associated serine/threonine protein kinase [Candidatus Micrarchaeota archaeon]|nr:Kae1-associated serine/threonine protein kinase [Candidatus Micrarchaeota archaeon]
MKIVGEGAEAKLYALDVFKARALVKVRIKKEYRVPQLDEEIRETRTRKEAKILYTLAKVGVNAPRMIGLGRFTIYMSRLEGKLLKDTATKPSEFTKIGKQLALMHNANVSHGDFTPANIMKCKEDYFIIDFGLAEISNSLEEKAIDLLLIKRSVDLKRYSSLLRGYAKVSKNSREILKRLEEIEKRGRYQVRTLS